MPITDFDQQEIVHRLAMIAAHCEHRQYGPVADGERCFDCGAKIDRIPRANGYRSAAGAVPAAPGAPLAEDAVRRVRDETEGWRPLACPECGMALGGVHRHGCQFGFKLAENLVAAAAGRPQPYELPNIDLDTRGAHSPADHGPEFWSSGCTAPVCVAERRRINGVPQTLSAEQAARLRKMVADFTQTPLMNWSLEMCRTLREILGMEPVR
jgi:hypothetical protein